MSAESAATPWVLLRGLTRDARHWGAFIAEFQQHFADAPLLAPDLPGNGLRHRERSPLSIAAMVEDLRTQLQTRAASGPYRVLALSLGAMVAVEWMRRYPDEVSAAVLINTSLRPYSRMTQRLRVTAWPQLLCIAVNARRPRAAEARVLQLTSNRHDAARDLLDDWTEWREQQPVAISNALRQLFAAARFSAHGAPAARVLLIASLRDRLVDVRCSRQLAEAWQCTLIEHRDAGHDLPLDDARWLASAVRDWV